MNKNGLIFKSIKLVLFLGIIAVLLIGVYFYYFHTFKEFRVCVSNSGTLTQIPCNDNSDCINDFLERNGLSGQLSAFPNFIKPYLNEVLNKSVYCTETCRYKEIYGDFEGTPVGECKENHQEVVYKIRGKEGLEWMIYRIKNSI